MTQRHIGKTLSAIALLCALSGCEDRKRAEALIGVATDLDAPAPLERVRMTIERFVENGANAWLAVDSDVTRSWDISGKVQEKFELPNSYIGYADPDDETKIRITVFAEGSIAGGRQGFIRRQAVFRLVPERTIFIRLPLTSKCVDNADCNDILTCVEGHCVNPEIMDSHLLPSYDPAAKPETLFQCDSGTDFRNTGTKASLITKGARCPGLDDVCIEGTCYDRRVFGENFTSAARPLTVTVQVTDAAGAPLPNAQVRIDDGANSLLRQLRTDPALRPGALVAPEITGLDRAGEFRITTQVSSNATEVQLTVTEPGHAPQIVTVPLKEGITQYLASAVLFGLREEVLPPGPPLTIDLPRPGTTAQVMATGRPSGGSLLVPARTEPLRLRYGLIDPAQAPGRTLLTDSKEFVQTLGVVYVEAVDQLTLPGLIFESRDLTVPAIDGAAALASAYRLDLQGIWRGQKDASATEPVSANQIRITSNGFWSQSKATPRPGCVRGRVVRPGGGVCGGVRVNLRGPTGAAAFDATAADGSFCAAGAQRETSIVIVGNSSINVYIPTTSDRTVCGGSNCADIGDVMVTAADCDQPATVRAGDIDLGDTCAQSPACRAGLSCFEQHCVAESFARVSISWTSTADYDLDVRPPGAAADMVISGINEKHRELLNVGRLDVEECSSGCVEGPHVESVSLMPSAPGGNYIVAVTNFNGASAGELRLRAFAAGKTLVDRMVAVPAGKGAQSEGVTIVLPPLEGR
jgi:hypothetical protein